mgnify:CR=1 FL=1
MLSWGFETWIFSHSYACVCVVAIILLLSTRRRNWTSLVHSTIEILAWRSRGRLIVITIRWMKCLSSTWEACCCELIVSLLMIILWRTSRLLHHHLARVTELSFVVKRWFVGTDGHINWSALLSILPNWRRSNNVSRYLPSCVVTHYRLISQLQLHRLLLLNLSFLQSSFKVCFFNIPIVHEVKIITFPYKSLSKHWNKLLIIWFLFKLKFPSIVKKMLKLFWITSAEIFHSCNGFLNFNLFVFLFFCLCRQSLPR